MGISSFTNRFRFPPSGALLWAFLCLVTAAWDGAVWRTLLETSSVGWVLLHLLLVSVAAASFLLVEDQKHALFWLALTLLVGCLIPVAGILFCAIAFVVAAAPEEDSFQSEIEVEFKESDLVSDEPKRILQGVAKEEKDLAILRWLDVQPLQDILHSDDVNYKRDVLTKLARKPDASSIQLIRFSLNDEDPEIRFYASSALSQIEQDVSRELNDLKKRLTDTPHDSDLRLDLVDQYLYIAELDLFPRETEEFYYECALELLTDLPRDEAFRRMGRALSALGRYEEMLERIDVPIEAMSLELLYHRCEALLKLHRFDELQEVCRRVPEPQDIMETVERQAVQFWNEEEESGN
ncbi:MAG: HEAT repeat domain-containing protein [Planctomycetota bacterium]|nr:HEAT repeat domain-containing protein [Planctomycetota bacterium]MDP6501959.1 HEAT repeat domain-containing protein [Planctomycetota bacterium]